MNPHRMVRGRGMAAIGLVACALLTGHGIAAADAADAGPQVTMAAGKQKLHVQYGKRIALRGAVEPAAAGRAVTLEYAPAGGAFRAVAQGSTDGDGRYALVAKPHRSGSLRAVVEGAGTSRTKRVEVAARPSGTVREHVLGRSAATLRGKLRPGLAGRTVYVEVRERGRWKTVDRARTRRGGAFSARWRPDGTGHHLVRVVYRGDRSIAVGRRVAGRMTVYRAGHASWYGPGLYGNRTACGQTLGAGTVGVAHKGLRCGTRVTFHHRGRTVTVPVIDRGPFVAGREWDLTAAAKQRLGFGSTGTVWAAH